jgi:hypothetical protein
MHTWMLTSIDSPSFNFIEPLPLTSILQPERSCNSFNVAPRGPKRRPTKLNLGCLHVCMRVYVCVCACAFILCVFMIHRFNMNMYFMHAYIHVHRLMFTNTRPTKLIWDICVCLCVFVCVYFMLCVYVSMLTCVCVYVCLGIYFGLLYMGRTL